MVFDNDDEKPYWIHMAFDNDYGKPYECLWFLRLQHIFFLPDRTSCEIVFEIFVAHVESLFKKRYTWGQENNKQNKFENLEEIQM